MINFGCFPLGFLVGIYVVIAPVTDHCFTLIYKFSKKTAKIRNRTCVTAPRLAELNFANKPLGRCPES